MSRLLFFAVIAIFGCKFMFGRWPWEFLKGRSTRSQAIFSARKLLAVRAEASREDIVEAHRRLASMVHPDKGGSNAQMHDANDARDLLLDELPGYGEE